MMQTDRHTDRCNKQNKILLHTEPRLIQ